LINHPTRGGRAEAACRSSQLNEAGVFMDKFRLVTRSDFDGLVCAVLLKHLDMIDEIKFVHPKDVQDGEVDIPENDILTNLPYAPGAHMVFDHHHSETLRNEGNLENYVIDAG